MSYVEHCKKHGQYHGEICGECFDDLKEENTKLRQVIESDQSKQELNREDSDQDRYLSDLSESIKNAFILVGLDEK